MAWAKVEGRDEVFIKRLMNIASPSGPHGRLSILIFHRIASQPDPIFPDEMHDRRFSEVCGWLKSWLNVLPLDAAVLHLKDGTLPARAACITFDDGYADNHDVAMPILLHHGLPATFFIATDFLDGGRMWNDTIIETVRFASGHALDLGALGQFSVVTAADKAHAINVLVGKLKYLPSSDRLDAALDVAATAKVRLPGNLMMTSAQVKALHRSGMQVGAHTLSHPILAQLSNEQAHKEIKESKFFLEQLLGERVGLFAYPNGKPDEDYTVANVAVVKSLDFDAAVTTQWGTAGAEDDPFQIRRFTPWDRVRWRFGIRLLANLRVNR